MSDEQISETPTIERVFDLLNRWRHLPAYQLERRADIFFALFLPEVLGRKCSVEVDSRLIPEFPIKKKGSNQSEKADYLALSTDRKQAFLIELKTDMDSISGGQYAYLENAACSGLQALIVGVLDICRASDKKPKYVHLLKLLSEIGLIEYEDGSFPIEGRGYNEALDRIKEKVVQKPKEDWPCLKVVYVQPRLATTISFVEFADFIEDDEGEEIRSLFAKRLREWAAVDAGSPNPW